MKIAFIGHRDVEITPALLTEIANTLDEQITENAECYFGGYGSFDFACAKTVRQIKKERVAIRSIFVTPYLTESYQERLKTVKNSPLYDEISYPPLERVPPRYAIIRRNEYMVDICDLLIAYIRHDFGGAYKTLSYAKRKNKKIINLAN